MARLATPNLGLGTWLDNEYPGAGSQTVPNTGLNGNWLTIDTSLGLQHNADGMHKANIIKGSNLVQTGGDSCVDGATLEFSSNKIRAKDGGLTGIKCNQTAGQFVDGSTLEFNTNAIRVKDLGIATAKIADNAITTVKIANANVTTEKLEYKEFIAIASQAGLGQAPVATVVKNTLGETLTFNYNDTGEYTIEGITPFTLNKTISFISNGYEAAVTHATIKRIDSSTMIIRTYNSSGTLTDSLLSSASIMIRVYP